MVRVRVLLVDDEPPALLRLSTLLRADARVTVVGTCEDGTAAIAMIDSLRPDVVLLDIEMPGATGFEVMEALGPRMPLTILVTAHDAYALRAFAGGVFDYVTKPIEPERLSKALDRAVERLRLEDGQQRYERVEAVLSEIARLLPSRRRMPMRHADGRVTFLDLGTVERVEVDGNHLRLSAGQRQHRIRMTLAEFEGRAPAGLLVRVHRSVMVNIEHVREVHPHPYGDFSIVMRDGSTVVSGRTYRDQVRALIDRAAGASESP